MFSKSEDSIAETEMSDVSSLDINTPAGTPISKLFSMCIPKDEDEEEEDDFRGETEDKTIEIKGRALHFEATESDTKENDGPVLFDTGLLFQMGFIGAVLAYEALA
jgi:hypothetical protein